MGKKAQVKFGETFAIMIVVYFAFIFGAQFYIGSLESSFEESFLQTQDTQALERLDFALNYGPFLNSEQNSKTLEFNKLNIEAFANIDERTKQTIFKNSEITLTIYTSGFDEIFQVNEIKNIDEIISIYNNSQSFYDESNTFTGKRIIPHSSIVTVYDPKEKVSQIGILTVKSYY